MSSSNTLRERIRARRERLKDTVDEDTETPRGTSRDYTWAAAMADDQMDGSRKDEDAAAQQQDEAEQSELLVKSLIKKRKKVLRQLDETLSPEEEDVRQKLKVAKQRAKQHLMEQQSATEPDDTAESTDDGLTRIPILADDEDRTESEDATAAGTSTSRPGTSRMTPQEREDGAYSARTPRRQTKAYSKIKDRLKEKIRTAKDKGKDEAYKDTAVAIKKPRRTRFEEQEAEEAEKMEKSMSKLKEAMERKPKQAHMASPAEAYDFFTRQWAPEEETAEATRPTPAREGAAAADETGAAQAEAAAPAEGVEEAEADKKKSEEEEPLIDAIDDEEDSWKYYRVARADYIPFREKTEKEEKMYFQPSILEANVTDKIFDQEEPRDLEDEGFFVGTRPPVSKKNLHKMENRLLKEPGQGKEWFGEDGVLIALPDPLKEVPSRPPIVEEIEPALETQHHKPYVTELDGRVIDASAASGGRYMLDVDVNTVVFTHHHLFSREHVLASRLTGQYKQYLARSQKSTAVFLTDKLTALKAAASHIQDNIRVLQDDEKNQEAVHDQEKRLKDYTDEIKQTRKMRDAELHADRLLLKGIIKTWKEIKSLRAFQQCTNTSVKLQIKKEAADLEADEAEWERDIAEEVQDLQEESEGEYRRDMQKYKEQLEEWKTYKLQKKEALKRQKQREKREARGENLEEFEEDMEQVETDREILAADEVAKPEKPKLVNDAEARGKVEARYNEIRRRPGEPKLHPELTSGATITPNSQCPRGEQQRRSDVNRYKVFARVLFNNKEVSRTPSKPLGQDFIVRFAQIFNIEIMQWPESINIEIYETSGLSQTLLSEVYAAIPDANMTSEMVAPEEMDFSSDVRQSHNHEGVGSGTPFTFEATNTNMLSLMTTGTLTTCVSWAVDEDGTVLVPPTANQGSHIYSAMKGMDAVAGIGMTGISDRDKLTKWITESRLDPNDPSNANIMSMLRPEGGGDAMLGGLQSHFRLEQLQEEFNFVTDEELDNSRRLMMIEYREQGIPEFKNKQIPMFDKEVPADAFQEYEKRMKEDAKLKEMDALDAHRAQVTRFIQKVREQVMLQFLLAERQKSFSDMVYEDAVPQIGTIIPTIMKLAEPRRPLKPIRKERKRVAAQNLQMLDVKILVNIVRGFDIPVRVEALQGSQATTTTQSQQPGASGQRTIKNIAGETLVRPFVEVMFQHNVQATGIADGPNPSWNEELTIPFKSPNNDYRSSELQKVHDFVHINLFDEHVIDIQQDDRDRGHSIHRRIEKRWLGSLKIPFSTIYFNSRIDGTFRINKPPVLLGYTTDQLHNKLDPSIDIGQTKGNFTYLTLFITIEPPLTPTEPLKHKFDSNEDEKLLEVTENWQSDLEKKFPKRDITTMVVDINGKFVFICRYFKALRPPEELVNGNLSPQHTAQRVARYVSLIPFVSDAVVFPGHCDIWSTCDQFMQMQQGDEEEHAVLLTNFFLFLGKQAWLLLGSAIPEGPTAYVLTKEDRDYYIWNASTGDYYSYRDNYCPVQSVGCLVNAENIWANIQANDHPGMMSFDLSNTSNWRPFFGKSFPNPGIATIQPEALIYTPTEKSYVEDIIEKAERGLKDNITAWRPRQITRWNRYCVLAFRKLLSRLEETMGKGAESEHMAELENVLGSYKLCGFPINTPFMGLPALYDLVFATGVHDIEHKDVEFALAVHINPYPNKILSVWIYVASLIKKR